MFRFFCGLAIALYFFTWTDILIWQRIFESNELWDLGIGVYHNGWTQVLFGFMALGALFFYPKFRRMIAFPISLVLLAFSGLEDILYYWMDGRSLPDALPWLDTNPLIFMKPVTSSHLILSALFWLSVVILLEVAGEHLERRLIPKNRFPKFNWRTALATWRAKTFQQPKKVSDIETPSL